jgi:hypothetical protein
MLKFNSSAVRGVIPVIPVFAFAFIASAFLSSCTEPEKTETWKEAEALHERMVQTGDKLHHELEATMSGVNDHFEKAIAKGDSALAGQLASISSRLDRFDGNFHAWSESVVAMPGAGCSHADHDSHDHGDHDHGDHDHGDHAAHVHTQTLPDGLSDEDMLEIQQEIMASLEVLKRNFASILAASAADHAPGEAAHVTNASESGE